MRYQFSPAFRRTIGSQNAVKPSLPLFRSISTNSTSNIPHDASRILDFWFSDPFPKNVNKWFQGGPSIDEEIETKFEPLITQARASQLDTWKTQPASTLALVLLLDQFPRNIYRGSPESFSSDAQALNITTEAIAKGFDRHVSLFQQFFLYLPFMHDEKLLTQVASQAMLELLVKRCDPESEEAKFSQQSLHFGEKHRDCVLRFGRFPSRNKVLGRESTSEEIAYLKEFPDGF